MKTTLLTAVAAIALSLGAASTSSAVTPENFSGVTIEKDAQIAKAGCYYRYFYVYNAYGYYYQYRYICY